MNRLAIILLVAFTTACSAAVHGYRPISPGQLSYDFKACRHVAEIKSIPPKLGVPVEDAYYNALLSNPEPAKSCLLDLITDETLMTDPRSEPTKVDGFVIGDLAFFLLSDFGLVSYDEVLPEEAKTRGVLSYFEWVKKPGNRTELQRNCREWSARHSKK